MIDANILLVVLSILFVAGLVTDHHTGWLSSTLIDSLPRRNPRRQPEERRDHRP
ncbi:hypothetical protein BH23CHL2_BH23CHL2_14390 [soil metagenome]